MTDDPLPAWIDAAFAKIPARSTWEISSIISTLQEWEVNRDADEA